LQLLTTTTLITWSTTRSTELETGTNPKKNNLYLKFVRGLRRDMVLWKSKNNKIVEKPLNFQHLHSKTRCSNHTKKFKWVGVHFKTIKTFIQKHVAQITLKILHYVWQRHALRLLSNGVQNSQVLNGVWGLKELAVSTNYWSNLLFKQCLKPWPNHSQGLAYSYNQSSS
jgi:hypothetical protein